MLRALWSYFKEEISPRWRSLLKGSELWLSVAGGVFLASYSDQIPFGAIKYGEFGGILLNYAAIALGFCLAGLTLVLTLPDHGFAKKLANTKIKRDAYSDLLFVFSWTSFFHWLVILVVVVLMMVWGNDGAMLPLHATIDRRIGIGLLLATTFYGFFQFLITLVTISQVGRLYIHFLKDSK